MDIYLSHMLVFRVAQKLNLEHIFKNDYLSYFTISIIVLVGAFIFSKSFQVIFNKIKRSIYHENTISK